METPAFATKHFRGEATALGGEIANISKAILVGHAGNKIFALPQKRGANTIAPRLRPRIVTKQGLPMRLSTGEAPCLLRSHVP